MYNSIPVTGACTYIEVLEHAYIQRRLFKHGNRVLILELQLRNIKSIDWDKLESYILSYQRTHRFNYQIYYLRPLIYEKLTTTTMAYMINILPFF